MLEGIRHSKSKAGLAGMWQDSRWERGEQCSRV